MPPSIIWPDDRAPMDSIHGELRQRRGLLPLLLLSSSWLRSYITRGHLRARLSSYRRGSDFWTYTVTRENRIYFVWTQLIQRMVRKWSYLNNLNNPLGCSPENSLSSKDFRTHHKFKVFRATTRFKRYSIGISRVVRKKHAQRKRRTNLLALSFLTYAWSKAFQKERQFVRFYQALGLFNVLACSSNLSVLSRKQVTLANTANVGINSCSLSRTILTHFLVSSPRSLFLKPKLSVNTNSFLSTSSPCAMAQIFEAGPSAIVSDQVLYPIDANVSELANTLSLLDNAITVVSLDQVKALRSLTVLLSILHLSAEPAGSVVNLL
jgi:hypothetical protein